jgi:hypothetical protein
MARLHEQGARQLGIARTLERSRAVRIAGGWVPEHVRAGKADLFASSHDGSGQAIGYARSMPLVGQAISNAEVTGITSRCDQRKLAALCCSKASALPRFRRTAMRRHCVLQRAPTRSRLFAAGMIIPYNSEQEHKGKDWYRRMPTSHGRQSRCLDGKCPAPAQRLPLRRKLRRMRRAT